MNGKWAGKSGVQTKSALKAQSKIESMHPILKKPIEPATKRVQPKRIVREHPKPQSSLNPIKEQKKSNALVKPWSTKQKVKIAVKVGQFVLAKQKYSVPWPSKVLTIRPNSVDVHFYGDGRKGPVKCDDLYLIPDSHDTIVDCLRRKIPSYSKGIMELERVMRIPDEASIFNFV